MRVLKLSSNANIPVLGFGAGTSWFKRTPEAQAAVNGTMVDAMNAALGLGFRHLDLAEMYGTDAEAAAVLRGTSIPRKDLWVTHKLLKSLPDVPGATQRILDQVWEPWLGPELGTSYLDLLLVHAPFLPEGAQLQGAWQAMEALVDAGKVTNIGVSNFRVEDLQQLLSFARIKPVINQVEFHPYLQQSELHAFCHSHGIAVAGYSGLTPLTKKRGGPVDEVVEAIASAKGATASQVLIMWALQKGVIVITTSSRSERLQEYLAAEAAVAAASQAEGAKEGRATLQALTPEEVQRIDDAGSKLTFRLFWQKEFGFVPDA